MPKLTPVSNGNTEFKDITSYPTPENHILFFLNRKAKTPFARLHPITHDLHDEDGLAAPIITKIVEIFF